MRTIILFQTVACFLIFNSITNVLNGQSLVKDTEDLQQAISILQQTPQKDSTYWTAAATVWAILYHYKHPLYHSDTTIVLNQNLLERYKKEEQWRSILSDSLVLFPSPLTLDFYHQIKHQLRQRQSGQRENITRLLSTDKFISPADYFSVSSAIKRYELPPVSYKMMYDDVSRNSNQNIGAGGFLNAQAVLEGVFNFVLNRAEQEVIITYIERLVHDDTPKFGALFPTVVEAFDKRAFTYSSSFVERLRQAFYEDLQLMSVRLPSLMLENEYFQPLRQDPVAYNMLVLYNIIGMSQNDLEIEEIMPLTYQFLLQQYVDTDKRRNLHLAETAADKAQYQQMIGNVETYIQQLYALYSALSREEERLSRDLKRWQRKHPEATNPPSIRAFLGKEQYNLATLLGDDEAYSLGLLPCLLRGTLDGCAIAQYNTLADYDKYFAHPKSPTQWRAAGLDVVRRMSDTWEGEERMTTILLNWQHALVAYRRALEQWKLSTRSADKLSELRKNINRQQILLINLIEDTKTYWEADISKNDVLAFEVLLKIVENFDDIEFDPNMVLFELEGGNGDSLKIVRKQNRLQAVEQRLIALEDRLSSNNLIKSGSSPTAIYQLQETTTTPYQYLVAEIDTLSLQLLRIKHNLAQLDQLYAASIYKEYKNIEPILQISGLTTQLLYTIRTDSDSTKWVSREGLRQVLDGGEREDIFLGLMQQRLEAVSSVGQLAPEGLAQLLRQTIGDLKFLPSFNPSDSLEVDSLKFYKKAAFLNRTLNRLTSFPIFVTHQPNSQQLLALEDNYPRLTTINQTSNQLLDFVYYINKKDHRHAVSSLLRLFTQLDGLIGAQTPNERRSDAIAYLQKYGDFIAGLIDAETAIEVENLLEGIADPPGSSRIKRRRSTTVGINAYVGVAFVTERWADPNNSRENFVQLAPIMPIGLTVSKLLGKQEQTSVSLFLSFLDLGALFTYRADNHLLGQDKFDARNMLRPGWQLQWNIQKSPFYLGIGGQYGVQYRAMNDKVIGLNTNRYFFNVGVDVPIKTLYQR